MSEETVPYARLAKESTGAWHGFQIYRDLGPSRTLFEVERRLRLARETGGAPAVIRITGQATKRQPKGKKQYISGKIGLWSSKHRWVERAAAWDAVVDRQIRDRQLDEIEKMARRQAQQATLLSDVLMRPVVELAQALQDPAKLLDITGVTNPMEPLAKLITTRGHMQALWELAEVAALRLPKLHEAERYARGVKVLEPRDGTPQGGTAIWNVEIYQPPREGPEPDLSILSGEKTREEWDGDRVPKSRRGQDDE